MSTTGWRGGYTATNGELYGVAGTIVWKITELSGVWSFTQIGTVQTVNTPVRFQDNSVDILLVDGRFGYTINLETDVFTQIDKPAFYGSTLVDLMDTYFLLNRPNTNQFYISESNSITFDALDFASKIGYSDPLVAVMSVKQNVFLFGQQTTEVWYNSGSAAFTFERMPGAFIQYGCESAHSIAQLDSSLIWLSKNESGQALILRTVEYDAQKISTYAIEQEISSYSKISDANAFTYQQSGHAFYVINFPSADKTWCYDFSTGLWHERAWLDENGLLHRHRANFHAFYKGRHVVGDWQNNNLYILSDDAMQDFGGDILRLRSFPHVVNEGHRIKYSQFIAAMSAGTQVYPTPDLAGLPNPYIPSIDKLTLRYSNDGGFSWMEAATQDMGSSGEYGRQYNFNRLGIARDRIFELSWTTARKTAVQGAYIQLEALNN